MYKIKQKLEDFKVKEEISLNFSEDGDYSYYLMNKINYNTVDAIRTIAKKLNINEKLIGYAGNKDKYALSEQAISIKNADFKQLSLKDIELKFLGKGLKPLSLGDNSGNSFEIVIRNINKKPKHITEFTNLFGEQRFSKQNPEVGKAIIKKDFKKACELINDEKIIRYLQTYSSDYANALRQLSFKHLTIYVNSYQSKLWNEMAEKFPEIEELPLVGFASKFSNEKVRKFAEDFLQKEGVSQRDFIIRAIPDLSSEGNIRKTKAKIFDLQISELEDDDLNEGMKKCLVKFTLPKGAYATEAVKQMLI